MKIYFGELANQAPAQRGHDESPTKENEVQGEEKTAIVDGEEAKVPTHWKKGDRVTNAQAAAILEYKQTRSIRRLVTDGKLRSAGTGYISVPSLLEFLDQKRPSPQS